MECQPFQGAAVLHWLFAEPPNRLFKPQNRLHRHQKWLQSRQFLTLHSSLSKQILHSSLFTLHFQTLFTLQTNSSLFVLHSQIVFRKVLAFGRQLVSGERGQHVVELQEKQFARGARSGGGSKWGRKRAQTPCCKEMGFLGRRYRLFGSKMAYLCRVDGVSLTS